MEESLSEQRMNFFKAQIGKDVIDSPSGFMNWLAPVIISIDSGVLVCKYTIRKEMTNP